ncbi:MAG: fimbrillin family protein [Prevotella sp.]|nr:fimbrillin family protein [Prevotella sp.]
MKKYFFLLSVAAVAMTACTNESNEYVGSSEAREITFSPITQNMTRATSDGATFNDDYTIKVAAYDITNSREFFAVTDFTKGATYWSASPAKYWPLSATNISFLGYTEFTGTSATFTNTQTLALTMTDNSTAQKDLMYACGYGAVTMDGTNGLTFPEKVDMTFKHAQAWIAFTVNADETTSGKITLKSITLNGAKYSGTYTVTHANWNSTTAADHSVSGAWSSIATSSNIAVPGWTEAAVAKADAGVAVGNGLLVVPDDTENTNDFTSFTITYKLDSKEYTYTYTPTSLDLQQGKKYTYNITFRLHEILINPSVTDWGSGSSTNINVI